MSFFNDIQNNDIINNDISQNNINDTINNNNTIEYLNTINNGCIVYLNIASKRLLVDYKHNFNKEYKTEYIPIGIAYNYNTNTQKAKFIFPSLLCKQCSVHAHAVNGIIQQFNLYCKRFIKYMPPAKSLKRLKIEIPTVEDYYRFISDKNLHELYKDIFGIDKFNDYIQKLKEGNLFLYKGKQLKFLSVINGKEKLVKPEMYCGSFMIVTSIKVYLY